MPCNCDYMEPNDKEKNSHEVAKHLVYIKSKLPYIKLPEYVKPASKSYYGDAANLNNMVVLLCDLLSTMRKVDIEDIVYNARNKNARKLADWWEEHQEADKKRIEQEEKINYENKLIESALNKLTEEEKRVLKKMYSSGKD